MKIVVYAILSGAFASAAWIAKPPFCYVFIAIATMLFMMAKQIQ